VAVPLVVASAIWYGALVWVGAFAGRNIDQLLAMQTRLNWTLTGIAGVIIVLVAWWWIRSRRRYMVDRGSVPELKHDFDDSDSPSE
jgi:membrane protein DedA with SNARE-associated domain